MKREFLKDLGLEDENVNKIMAELGKETNSDKTKTTELEEQLKKANETIEAYKTKIVELENVKDDNTKLTEKINTMVEEQKQKEAEEKAKKDDEILTNNIVQSFGDKKFVNDYTKNAIINDIKTALKDVNNSGKSSKDMFEELTKDKQDRFANPNELKNMAGMGDTTNNETKKEIPMFW